MTIDATYADAHMLMYTNIRQKFSPPARATVRTASVTKKFFEKLQLQARSKLMLAPWRLVSQQQLNNTTSGNVASSAH